MREVSNRSLQRELAIVATLRHVGASVGPDRAERDRMRHRLMTEFSSVVHEGNSPVLPLRRAQRSRWIPEHTRGRLVVAAAAALCLLMSLSGMSLLLSRDALPGDALYSFKRTAESAELGLAFGDQPKALKHLEFASTRVNEIEAMADQVGSSGGGSTEQGKFVRTLDDFDSDATAGARLLTGLAFAGQPSSLPALRTWADQQKTRLTTIRAALTLPTSSRMDSTLALLDRISTRASALSHRSGCATMSTGARDELGILPARDTCKPVPVDGATSAIPLPSAPATSEASQPSAVVPPNLLLRPPSASAVPVPTPSGSASQQPNLPGARNPSGVLPGPNRPGSQPWRPLPGNDSPQPTAPLPPWILQPRLMPPAG